MKNNKKKKYIIILFLLVLSLSVGFALLQANLKINGSSKIKGSSWDIHFENLNVTNGSVELSTGDVGASIQSSRTDITYTITLNMPGDFYEFTVDAVNAGTVDGMVESVTSKLNNQPITTLPSYLNYSVSYSDEVPIEVNHLLKAGESEAYKVRVEYKRDINSTDMPSTAQTLSLSFGVVYVQADSNGVEVEHLLNGILYSINNTAFDIVMNQEYPRSIPYFETPSEALSAFATSSGKDLPFYLKNKVENGIVTESYVEFIVTEALAQSNAGMVPGTYTLRGEKTYDGGWLVDNDYVSLYYEANKAVIKTAFGYDTNPSRCSQSGSGITASYSCTVQGLQSVVFVSGSVVSRIPNNAECRARYTGQCYCS